MHSAPAGAIITIDGPAAAGKSTFADQLCSAIDGWTLIRLDDVYPGWSGLEVGVERLRNELIAPFQAGLGGVWPEWSWTTGEYVQMHTVPPSVRIIVEGCGATATVPNRRGLELQLWIDVEREDQRRRIVDRDGDAFDEFWPTWAEQWEEYLARFQPHLRSAHVISGLSPTE